LPALERLLALADERAPGPMPTFTRAHLLLAFTVLGEASAIGRSSLAEKSGLGEGAMRTVLRKLVAQSLVRVSASGCSLTKEGRELSTDLRGGLSGFFDLEASPLAVGRAQTAVVVTGAGAVVKDGIEQRDSAIKLGASGATTYAIRHGRFAMPGGSPDCESDFPSPAWKRLRSALKPREGDALVVCGADGRLASRLGAAGAAITLLRLTG
jgi:Domain of unknown function (DUF4443)/CggR N-terminal DNA binding domain